MSPSSLDSLRTSLATRTVLVIDDSEAVRTAFDVLLSLQGVRVLQADSPDAGLLALSREHVDVVIQDMNFRREATTGAEGVALFRQIRTAHPDVPIVLLTAWTQLETAVELVKAGAADYIAKPWDDARLLTTLRNLMNLRDAQQENRAIHARRAEAREDLAARFNLCGVVYISDEMHTLITLATQVAHADVPVLITGPNGAGKEVLADIIHANSAVANKSCIKVNLGALPDSLIEAELFGTESGAFTGAKARPGRFEAADGGTLFLDEIGNLPLAGQTKLLRVLQSGEYERLGSSVTRHCKTRIVAATNASLPKEIAAGRFREDLYYRLNVIELLVPALADRRDDILPLARHFLGSERRLSPDSERALLRHDWPGNVRELSNALRRAALLSSDALIAVAALGLPTTQERGSDPAVDKSDIEAALAKTQGNIARTARDLGLSRQALYRRMEKLGIKTADVADRP